MLAVEVQRLFKIIFHVVANSNFVNGDFSSLKVVKKLRAEIQPFQKFDSGVVFLSVFLDECHTKGHVSFPLNITYFNTRSCFHLHILKLIHLVLGHTFQRKTSRHDLIHQAEVLWNLNRKLTRKWTWKLCSWHHFSLIVLCVNCSHYVVLFNFILFLFFFYSVHFIII